MSIGDHKPSRLETGFLPAISPRLARRQFQISVALVVIIAVGVYALLASLNAPRHASDRPLSKRPAATPLLASQ
ncbi:hypothetical protein [Beijerinckia indica]|uniref:Uncharacterized protein n=1 Tax=Beijerinckia indica subsp. indica (strain ATCC 9039 / DSM 1715 / NCIMB 8712) TaxID=395963 RepID=B2IB37_BEII9|nr:hypothetical protein [Beijerinckia indica]ACB93737.1 hypothetical protein Bind_0078 [Beijerinckia indica subsp. indica ATCC 9039]